MSEVPSGARRIVPTVESMRAGGGLGRHHGGPRNEREPHRTAAAAASPAGRGGRRRARSVGDARTAKGDRTRQVLLESLVALVDEGVARPTVAEVAGRAGVSVRIVYHHFAGVQDLLDAAVALQAERHRGLLFTIPPRGPPGLRITALCRQRRMYFEVMTPIYRLAIDRSPLGAGPAGLLAADRSLLREQLAHTLGPELRRAVRPGIRTARGARARHRLGRLAGIAGLACPLRTLGRAGHGPDGHQPAHLSPPPTRRSRRVRDRASRACG